MDNTAIIQLEQARYLQRNTPFGTVAGALGVWLLVFLVPDQKPGTGLLLWAGAFSAITLSGLIHFRRSRDLTKRSVTAWLRRTTISNAIGSCILGAGAFLVLQLPQFEYQLIFLYVAFVVVVVSIFSYAPYYPTFVAVVMPLMIGTTTAFSFGGSRLHWSMAAGQVLVVAVVLYFGRTFNRVFLRSLALRFENQDLVERLRLQIEAVEAANMAKSRFLAAASHDLRQPMHALNLYLGALSGTQLPERAQPLLTNAAECAQTMDDMFRSLLDVSSLDAGVVQPELNVFPVAAVLDRLRVAFAPAATAKGLQLHIRPSAAFVRSDPALVERIAGNLVANAVRYTRNGGVLVGCRRKGGNLQLAVYDTGPGIDADKQAHVFEEFYQVADAERDRSQGIGLGLAIVQRLARLLNTSVTLRSRPGRGSIFAIELPRGDATVRHFAAPSIRAEEAPARLNKAFIVVIDDEKLILNATRAVLEMAGSFVLTATSGAEALRQLGHSKRIPDAIICDYRLHGEERGTEVVERVREEFNAEIPAMLITGDTSGEKIQEFQNSGLMVLHKPLREKELLAAVSTLLDAAVRDASLQFGVR